MIGYTQWRIHISLNSWRCNENLQIKGKFLIEGNYLPSAGLGHHFTINDWNKNIELMYEFHRILYIPSTTIKQCENICYSTSGIYRVVPCLVNIYQTLMNNRTRKFTVHYYITIIHCIRQVLSISKFSKNCILTLSLPARIVDLVWVCRINAS